LKNLIFFQHFGSKTDLSKLGKISELKHRLPPFLCKNLEQITANNLAKLQINKNSANLTGTVKITFTY
jgi:hypothetical protein